MDNSSSEPVMDGTAAETTMAPMTAATPTTPKDEDDSVVALTDVSAATTPSPPPLNDEEEEDEAAAERDNTVTATPSSLDPPDEAASAMAETTPEEGHATTEPQAAAADDDDGKDEDDEANASSAADLTPGQPTPPPAAEEESFRRSPDPISSQEELTLTNDKTQDEEGTQEDEEQELVLLHQHQRQPSGTSPQSAQLRKDYELQRQPSGTHIEEKKEAAVSENEEADDALMENRRAAEESITTPPPPHTEGNESSSSYHAPTILDVLQNPTTQLPLATTPARGGGATYSSPPPKTPHPTPTYKPMMQHVPTNIPTVSTPLSAGSGGGVMGGGVPGRRSITLRLLEEISRPPTNFSSPLISSVKGINTPFRSLRRFRSLSLSANSKTFSSAAADAAAAENGRGGDAGSSLEALDEKTPSPTSALKQSTETTVDRGTITVSWYEGTTSAEMTEHVFNCVLRKLNADINKSKKEQGKVKLEDVRLLDENVIPHGEVVLCPYLPDGSHFLLKFKTSIERPVTPPKVNHRATAAFPLNPYSGTPYVSTAPDSPSAEPSPFPSSADLPSLGNTIMNGGNMKMNGAVNGATGMQGGNNGMNKVMQQQHLQTQQMLGMVAAMLQQQQQQGNATSSGSSRQQLNGGIPTLPNIGLAETPVPRQNKVETPREEKKEEADDTTGRGDNNNSGAIRKVDNVSPPTMEPIDENSTMTTTDQLIEQQLLQLNKLFVQRRSGIVTPNNASGGMATSTGNNNSGGQQQESDDHQAKLVRHWQSEEKKQVIFVISNYLLLFLSLIALSAEIQSRLPQWMETVQSNYDSVQNCATDRDALMECLSNGDFSGLVASFLLWATQSAAAKRIFLFGFDTPKKLWTVVYEALVSAVCWGTSYLFIRRGLNPNTRQNFLHKYWKDAVYGSLAGFNAAFMKAVLKNLVPEDVALESLEGGRQLRIFHWLGSLIMAEEQ